MTVPLLSNRLSVQFCTRSVLAPADAVTPTIQFGAGGTPHDAPWPTVGSGLIAADASTRAWTPTASHACVIARSALLLRPKRSRAAWIVATRASAKVEADGISSVLARKNAFSI